MTGEFARRDYYRLLQIDPAAHPEIVRAAYRTLLRVLGKHPDVGGSASEASAIIEAYATVSNPERRRAYDAWLRAHTAPPRPGAGLPDDVAQWLRSVLAEYHEAPTAPFAGRFDLVLEAPAPSSDRLYVKAFPLLARDQWPTVFTLCRAVSVARRGVLPSTDVVLMMASRIEELKAFLDESVHHSSQWSWNRSLIAVCTRDPFRLHTGRIMLMPSLLRRLGGAA
ncbi:MAG TPA: J domain-containing protein [Candidatus Bathyarchaeia archaeon]|nr:J domain-containing protein [Candidatus Bathyarchaeia archaeon]